MITQFLFILILTSFNSQALATSSSKSAPPAKHEAYLAFAAGKAAGEAAYGYVKEKLGQKALPSTADKTYFDLPHKNTSKLPAFIGNIEDMMAQAMETEYMQTGGFHSLNDSQSQLDEATPVEFAAGFVAGAVEAAVKDAGSAPRVLPSFDSQDFDIY